MIKLQVTIRAATLADFPVTTNNRSLQGLVVARDRPGLIILPIAHRVYRARLPVPATASLRTPTSQLRHLFP